MQPEVVFFYGPPFSGKAFFYIHHFLHTHERISPHELFEADPSLSLRAVILKVVNVINKGKNVVVDDENSSKKSRKSYLNILRNKVPYCTVRVVNFHVSTSDGLFLCQWAREWHLANQFECLPFNTPLKEIEKEVEHWFAKRAAEQPDEEEGFSKIDQIDIQLICDTPYKFIVPALFLQWEGLFKDVEDLQCDAEKVVSDVVKRWSHSNPCGRVIVLKLSNKQPCNSGSCECVKEMKQVISELVIQAAIPVFFVHMCSFLAKFNRPPNPGQFAWLQRLHNIDLPNRATFYVYSSEDHQKSANAAGVKCIKANKLLQNPQMINAVQCGLAAQVPDCVRKAKLACFSLQSRPTASVPLFHRAASSHDPSNAAPQCITVENNERVHGVCFKDFETLDRFNSQYQHVAEPTEPASNDIFKYKDCLNERSAFAKDLTQSKLQCSTPSSNVTVATNVLPDNSSVSSKVDQQTIDRPISPSLVAKQLTRKDIESLAFSAGHFRRGEGCLKLIRNVTTSMEEGGVLFAAKCLGSQGQLYNVSALLSQKGIEQAGCSCADPASHMGKCKHAVGLLLWCKNEKNMKEINKPTSPCPPGISNLDHGTKAQAKPKEAMCTVAAKSNQMEEPAGLGKSKSLPKWMSSLTQSSSIHDDGGKRMGDEVSPAKLHSKRMKSKKSAENTFYCLSPEELLQTAEEILTEYHCSLRDHCEKEAYRLDNSKKQSAEDGLCRAKPSARAVKQPHQPGNSTRENVASVNSDVLMKETFADESHPEARSKDLNVSLVVPETVASITEEPHCLDNSPGLNKPPLRVVASGSCEQGDSQDRTVIKQRGKTVKSSILDDFI